MASHDDRDSLLSEKQRSELRKLFGTKAEEMTNAGLNLITAGAPGEKEVMSQKVGTFWVRRLPEDTLALRISVGEAHKLEDSAYLVFRGDPRDIIELLDRALSAMKAAF